MDDQNEHPDPARLRYWSRLVKLLRDPWPSRSTMPARQPEFARYPEPTRHSSPPRFADD